MERDGSRKNITTARVISTHTLTWSVTAVGRLRAPMKRISTHTLTWSVTGSSCSFLSVPCHFNSHAHVERDVLTSVKYRKTDFVISTHTLTWSVTG